LFKSYSGKDQQLNLPEFLKLLHDRMIPNNLRKTIDEITVDMPKQYMTLKGIQMLSLNNNQGSKGQSD